VEGESSYGAVWTLIFIMLARTIRSVLWIIPIKLMRFTVLDMRPSRRDEKATANLGVD